MKKNYEIDAKAFASTLTDHIDRVGHGLSTEREAQMKKHIESFLERHEVAPASKQPAKTTASALP